MKTQELRKVWAQVRPVLAEVCTEVLVPLFILTASFLVALGYYLVLGYINIVRMLLRELLISLEKPVTIAEPKSAAKGMTTSMKLTIKEEPVKLVLLNEIPELAKPLSVAELRKMGQAAGIKGARSMRKDDLLIALGLKE